MKNDEVEILEFQLQQTVSTTDKKFETKIILAIRVNWSTNVESW